MSTRAMTLTVLKVGNRASLTAIVTNIRCYCHFLNTAYGLTNMLYLILSFSAEISDVHIENETSVNLTSVVVDVITKTEVTVDYFAPTGETGA